MEQLFLRKNKGGERFRTKVVMTPTKHAPDIRDRLLWIGLSILVAIFALGVMFRYLELNKVEAAPPQDISQTPEPTAVPVIEPTAVPQQVLSRVFTPTVLRWESLIVDTAWRYGFDPNLLAIVVQIESCGDPLALSHAGAMGLGQVMPFHFQPGENPYDPVTNLNRGAAYFAAGLKSSNNDIGLTFAGYNGGHGTVQKGRWAWKAETVRYFDAATAIFWDIKNGLTESPMIRDRYAPSQMCLTAASR